VAEIYGAINYLAAAAILMEEDTTVGDMLLSPKIIGDHLMKKFQEEHQPLHTFSVENEELQSQYVQSLISDNPPIDE
jgi:hypothetical protein